MMRTTPAQPTAHGSFSLTSLGSISSQPADIAHQLIEVRGEKFTVLGNSRDFGVPHAAADMITTRPTLKSHRGRFKNFFMAYAESVMVGRKNKELVLRALREYMRLDDPKVLEGTYRIQFLETISPRPFPNEEAIQIQVEDLAASTAPKLKGAKAAEFIDVSLLRELESEGFFARVEKQQRCRDRRDKKNHSPQTTQRSQRKW